MGSSSDAACTGGGRTLPPGRGGAFGGREVGRGGGGREATGGGLFDGVGVRGEIGGREAGVSPAFTARIERDGLIAGFSQFD